MHMDLLAQKSRLLFICTRTVYFNCYILYLYSVSQTVCGTVASVEDRGCVIDLGIKGTKAFLTEKDSAPCIKDGYSMDNMNRYIHLKLFLAIMWLFQ